MRMLLSIVIMICGCGVAYALDVSGSVRDADTGKPVSGVTVGIRELDIVMETDNRGEFAFTGIEKGFYELSFAHRDYGNISTNIRVKRAFRIEKRLGRKVYDAGTKTKTYDESLRSKGERTIFRDDIKKYPMRGIGDSLHLLQSLPGVGGASALSTVPVIRGSNPLFNKYYIDDIPVDYPYHYLAGFVPLFSSINEEAIDTVSLVKGNAPIWTGDNLGNVITVRSADAERGGVHGKMILDPLVPLLPTFSLSVAPYERLSVTAVGRRSTNDLLVDMNRTRLYFADYFLKAVYVPDGNNRITVTGTGSRDDISYNDLSTRSGYSANGIGWDFLVRSDLFVKTVLSNQSMMQELKNERDYSSKSGAEIAFNPDQYRLFQMATLSLSPFSLRAGYEAIKYTGDCSGNTSLSNIADVKFYKGTTVDQKLSFPLKGKSMAGFGGFGGAYGGLDYDAGIKYEYYSPTDDRVVSYNVNAGYTLNNMSSVYFKHGRYYAHPDMYYYLGNLDPDFKMAKALNFAFGADIIPIGNVFLNAETYYCRFDNLSPGTIFNVNDDLVKKGMQLHPYSEEEDGHTLGLELSGKGGLFGFEGWVSYAYSRSTRNNGDVRGFSSDFDQTHLLRVVLSRSWTHWSASLIWHMTSSMPYTPVSDYVRNGSSYTVNYGDRNSARYAMNKRLDFRGTYRTDGDTRVSLECWNILFFRNNAVAEKQNSSSTDTKYDIPFFIWISLEKPL